MGLWNVVTLLRVMASMLLFTHLLSGGVEAAQRRPNILFLSIDDLRPELGCYGVPHVISPNIDRLSSSGVTFDRCYVQVAVCNPSRASLMTGLRPNTLRCWTLRYHFRETRPDAITLPQYLRQHGYQAEGYGKIFHNPWQDPRSWSRPHQWGEGDFSHYSNKQRSLIDEVNKTLPENAWQRDNLRGPITNAPDIPDDDHPDGSMAALVVDRLEAFKSSDEPFFLAAGFVLPHLPWCPPKKYWDLYDREQLPLAANPDPPTDVPAVALGTNYELRHYADTTDLPAPLEGRVADDRARRFIHGYLAAVSFVDAQVGRILAALEAQQLTDNTIVVLWSDHGYKLGEHNGWGKMTNFEIDARIPLIIRDPRRATAGRRCGSLVEVIDIFPTLCELADVSAPAFAEGTSAAHLLDDPDAPHIDAAYSQYIYRPLIGNSIRTTDWRYTEWRELNDGAVKHRELYDHRSDNGENHNVFGRHAGVEALLERQLRDVLPAQRVTLLPQVHSARGGEQVSLEFVNRYTGPVRLSWINPAGERAQVYDLTAGQTRRLNSFVGHIFVAESLDGRYDETLTVAPGTQSMELGNNNLSPDPDENAPQQ